jgi:hypothetical protein
MVAHPICNAQQELEEDKPFPANPWRFYVLNLEDFIDDY